MQKSLKIYIILLFVFGGYSTLSAQVATPDLDPTIPSEMSMAAGWRFDSVVGAVIGNGSSKTEDISGSEIEDGTMSQSVPDAFVALKLGILVVEYLHENQRTWSFNNSDPSSDFVDLDMDMKSSGGAVSLLVDGYATLGVGMNKAETSSHYYKAGLKDQTIKEIEDTLNYGISFRFSQSVFFTYGQTQHERTGSRDDVITGLNEDYQPLKWTSQIGGAGFIFGGKAGFFRGEVGIELSPEVTEESDASHLAAYQREILRTFGTAQFLFKNMILSYHRDSRTIKGIQNVSVGLNDENDQEELTQKFGLGWTLFNQISMNGYSITEEIESHQGGKTKNQTYQFRLGFTF